MKKLSLLMIISLFMFAIVTSVSAITLLNIQNKLVSNSQMSNITQLDFNTLRYTYTGIISKIEPYYNITTNITSQVLNKYNGTRIYQIDVINNKRININIINENLTLLP